MWKWPQILKSGIILDPLASSRACLDLKMIYFSLARVASTFDFLTSKVDRFVPLTRGSRVPICLDIGSFVFKISCSHFGNELTDARTNGQTDGKTNGQAENIMPSPATSGLAEVRESRLEVIHVTSFSSRWGPVAFLVVTSYFSAV